MVRRHSVRAHARKTATGARTVRNHTRGGGVPKNFRKLATAPTREGIERHIANFYGGETGTQLSPMPDRPGWFALISATGKTLTPVVIETPRGFYFGVPA